MAYLRYKIYPDDPEATKKSKNNAIVGMIVWFFSILAIVSFISSIETLFNKLMYEDLIFSILFIIIMGIIIFYYITSGINEKKEFAKKYFLFFLGGVSIIVGIIITALGIFLLCHNEPGLLILIISIGFNIIICTLFFLIYNKINNNANYYSINSGIEHNPAISTDSTRSFSIKFCHKCGFKIIDGNYCSKCGALLKRE